MKKCKVCKKIRVHSKGMCSGCYQIKRREKIIKTVEATSTKCSHCNKCVQIYKNDLCYRCYKKSDDPKNRICKKHILTRWKKTEWGTRERTCIKCGVYFIEEIYGKKKVKK